MIVEEFISKLASKFKDKKDNVRNETFREDLLLFVNACPERYLLDVYRWVSLNHKYSTPFLLSKIYDYAKKAGYIEDRKKESALYWHKCECGVEYSKEGRGCPKCRSHKSKLITGDSAPNNMILVHEDCYYCTIYPESVKSTNNKKVYGGTCSQYGTINNQDRVCGNCECKECCVQMNAYNVDPNGTVEKYRTTELAQPWLMPCEALNETAQKMFDHMTRKGE
jgi:hypothetical protein